MTLLVRRSNLCIPINDRARVQRAGFHHADAVTLDLSATAVVPPTLQEDIQAAAKGGAEIFVRLSPLQWEAQMASLPVAALTGVMLSKVESVEQLQQAEKTIATLEKKQGLDKGHLQWILGIDSARGVWHIRSILAACDRLTQIFLDEKSLATDLELVCLAELDPFDYARGRLVVETTAASVSLVGMSYPLSVTPVEEAFTFIHENANKARNLGLKGMVCPFESWVAPVNQAFTPTPELVEWNRRVRIAFAEGVAAGTAAVPLDGKMIDVPVDEWAIVVLEMAQACAQRDEQKRLALLSSGVAAV